MWQSVRDAFPEFTKAFEGFTTWMYLDVKGLVTTGVGNLIDPCSVAEGMPWKLPCGSPASQDQIRAEWLKVKSAVAMDQMGGGAFAKITSLRLTGAAVTDLVVGKMLSNESILAGRISNWETIPADAQMAMHSMAWACGAGLAFPRLLAAVEAQDFVTASVECHMDDAGNPGLKPRNAANAQLFVNAATCINANLPRSLLQYV